MKSMTTNIIDFICFAENFIWKKHSKKLGFVDNWFKICV
jgi:hypothetical protein